MAVTAAVRLNTLEEQELMMRRMCQVLVEAALLCLVLEEPGAQQTPPIRGKTDKAQEQAGVGVAQPLAAQTEPVETGSAGFCF